MKKTLGIIAAAISIFAIFALCACSSDDGFEQTEATIDLEANPTTGYEWTLADDYDKSIVTVSDMTYTSDNDDEELVGVGGTAEWTLTSVAPGSTELTFTYQQSWEPSTAVVQVAEVVVSDDGSIQVDLK